MSTPDTPTAQALRRLQVSRGHLLAALSPEEQAGKSPLPGMAWAALRLWWQQQPLAASAQALAQDVRAFATPLLRRHPLAAVLAAALAGGAVVALRPWRLLHTQLGPWLFAHATSPTMLATFGALAAQWMTQASAHAPAPASAPTGGGMSDTPDTPSSSATAGNRGSSPDAGGTSKDGSEGL